MKDYEKQAVRTEAKNTLEVTHRVRTHARLIHAAMGLCTEAGEFNDELKKHIFYGKELDETNLKEEMGDLLWYIALALDAIDGTSIQDLMERNIAKLKKRYPQHFTSEKALNRDLEAERKELEISPMMDVAIGMLNQEVLPNRPEVSGPLREYTEQTIDLEAAKATGISNNPATLLKSEWIGEWIGEWPSKPECPDNVVVREDKELPPPKSKPKTPEENLVEKFGREHVTKMTNDFYQDFCENIKRHPQEEDFDLFFYRWWKQETKQDSRPKVNVKDV